MGSVSVEGRVAPPIVGGVDRVQAGLAAGWIVDTAHPLERCTVAALHRGRVVSEAVADGPREDLKARGYGDGRYAFELVIPPGLSASDIEIVEQLTQTNLEGSGVRVDGRYHSRAVTTAPLLLVDLTGTIDYLARYDFLTGIQRVQANFLGALVEGALVPVDRVRIIHHDDRYQAFRELPLEVVTSVLEDARRELPARGLRRADAYGPERSEAFSTVPLVLDDEDAGSTVILLLGSAWGHPTYFQAVRSLKKRGARFVPLLYDLGPLVLPVLSDDATAAAFEGFVQRAVRNGDHVFTLSDHTKRELMSYCEGQGLACPPVTVTRCGQTVAPREVAFQEAPSLVDGDYVLYVSTIEGRKNHRFALNMWERLRALHGAAVPTLVLVGRFGSHTTEFAERLHETNSLDGKVVILSEVADGALASLYSRALFTIYPSLYEGWGLPVGESLSFGKVCLASNGSSIPEAGSGFALCFDPSSLDDAVEKANRLICDEPWRKELESQIAANFRPITWNEVAAKIVDALAHCSSGIASLEAPLLDVGEYSFASAPPADRGAVVPGEAALRPTEHSRPLLTNYRLTRQHYLRTDECIWEGISYPPERWGRWGHWNGNTIAFRVPDPNLEYLALLTLRVPAPFVPALLMISSPDLGTEVVQEILSPEFLVRIATRSFMRGDLVQIRLELREAAAGYVDGDQRALGIGLSRLALIENVPSERLQVLERLADR